MNAPEMKTNPQNVTPIRTAGAEPKFLSRGAVARLFGVSSSTVTRWARTGLLRAIRTPGGHYRFAAEDMRKAVLELAPPRPNDPR